MIYCFHRRLICIRFEILLWKFLKVRKVSRGSRQAYNLVALNFHVSFIPRVVQYLLISHLIKNEKYELLTKQFE